MNKLDTIYKRLVLVAWAIAQGYLLTVLVIYLSDTGSIGVTELAIILIAPTAGAITLLVTYATAQWVFIK